MNKIWKVVSLIGLLVITLGTISLAYAQTESPQPYSNPGYSLGMMGGRGSYGGGMVYGEVGPYHDIMMESFAEALGLTVSQMEARLESGETMLQIFEAEGFTWDEFFAIMKDARSVKLEQAVEDGTLTQEQADFMNSRGQARGYGRGYGGCVGNGYGDQDGFHRGPHGMWNAP
jgi:hypothetical protein